MVKQNTHISLLLMINEIALNYLTKIGIIKQYMAVRRLLYMYNCNSPFHLQL